jgi:hypothetical protein
MGYFFINILNIVNDHKADNKTMAVARQQPMRNNESTVGSVVFYHQNLQHRSPLTVVSATSAPLF